MVEKKYYWLKFQQDFFKSLRIKKLRHLAGGDTFTIIYLKMQLLSLKNEGYLYFKNVFSTFEEEIAEEIDEDLENVQVTINYLLSVGLLERSEDTYFLPYVPLNTGSETAAAERMRAMRDRKNVTMLHDSYTPVIDCYTEKEIEKEKDIEIDNIYSLAKTAQDVIEYLNQAAGTHYLSSTAKTKKLIQARLNEKFTLEDFHTVIDKKVKAWKNDPKMCKYLRPETLFGNKFEGYLNEVDAVPGSRSGIDWDGLKE